MARLLLAVLLAAAAAGAAPQAEPLSGARSNGFRRVVFQNGKECLCEITGSTSSNFSVKQPYSEARFKWSIVKDVQAVTTSTVLLANARIYLDADDKPKALETLASVLKSDPGAKLDAPLAELLAEDRREAVRKNAEARSRGLAEVRQSLDKLDYRGALAKLDALLDRFPGDSEMLNLAIGAQAKALGPTADLSQSKYVQSLRSVSFDASLAEWAEESQAQLQARQDADAQEGRTAQMEAEPVSQPAPVLNQQPQYPYLFGSGSAYGSLGYGSLGYGSMGYGYTSPYSQSFSNGQIYPYGMTGIGLSQGRTRRNGFVSSGLGQTRRLRR